MTIRLVALMALTLFGSIAVTGAARAGACDAAPESTEIKMLGDWLPWAAQAPFIAAQAEGYYSAEGLDFELIPPANPADTIKLVAGQSVHFTMTYVPDIMQAREAGIPIVSVAALLRPLSTGLEVRGDSGIMSPADFKGKTLAVNPIPSALAEMRTVLASVGLTENDVKVIDPGFAGITMLLEGKVDGLWGLSIADPYILDPAFAEQGKPPIRFFANKDYGVPNYYFMVIGGSEEWAAENPAATCRYLRASLKGLESWLADPDKYLKAISDANDLYSHQQHSDMAGGVRLSWKDPDGTVFRQELAVWEKAQDWALNQELLTKRVDASAFFSNAYLP